LKYHFHLLEKIKQTVDQIFIENKYADKSIEKEMKAHPKWGARDRRFFAETVYEIVRWYRKLEYFADRLPSAIDSDKHWRMIWVYFELKSGEPPQLQIVNDSVSWKQSVQGSAIALQKSKDRRAIQESVPDWLDQYGEKYFDPLEWESILKSLNQQASIYLRANTLRNSAQQLVQSLNSEDVPAELVPGLPSAVRLIERKNVFTTAAFKNGLFEIQDAASQMVAELLGPVEGERIVDACAGAGGKSLHIASLMKNKGRIVSLDIHGWKLEELKKRARRNGIDIIETRVIDTTKVIKRLADLADGLLLDVPCTGVGVLRRNPDAKWKITQASLDELLKTQEQILDQYTSMVKKGGRFVYATCSFFPQENHLQLQSFLAKNPDRWSLEKELHLFPHKQGYDGFYAARVRRVN
jgi:16S rRNA (cytosine967-C5)-methyltransferase